MARVLRTRPSFNESTSDHSPTGGRELNGSRTGKRYRTPEDLVANTASSSPHLITRESPQAESQYTDDEDAIYVRSKYSPQDGPVASPRKRRRTEQSLVRRSGSPTASLPYHESDASASSNGKDPAENVKQSSKTISQLSNSASNPDQSSTFGINAAPSSAESLPKALDAEIDQPKDQVAADKAITSTDHISESFPNQPDSEIEYGEEDEDAADGEASDDDVADEDAADEDEDGEGNLEDDDEDQDDMADEIAHGETFSVASEADGASAAASPEAEPMDEPAEPEVPSDPNELTEIDLPPPFTERPSPPVESTFTDPASYLLALKFAPLSSAQQFVTALTKHAPANRSMETLYRLAQNTQEALQAWQDEFLILDKRTAPIGNPPKKPATGGREPLDPSKFEAAKEADLYSGYVALRAHGIGSNDEPGAGRGLRRRRRMGGLDSWNVSEDDVGAGANGKGKRTRRPVRRFDEGAVEMSPAESITAGRRRRGGGGGGDSDTIGERTRKRGRVSTLARSDDFVSSTADISDDGGTYGVRRRGGGGARGGGNVGGGAKRRKQRVKSEKRSESMTLWWAERKKKAAEQKIRELRKQGLLDSKDASANAGGVALPQ